MSDALHLTAPERVGREPDPLLGARDRGRRDALATAEAVSNVALMMLAHLRMGPADWLDALHPADEAAVVTPPFDGDAELHDQWASTFWPTLLADALTVVHPPARVRRGAAALDRWEQQADDPLDGGHWWDAEHLELERLVLESCDDCVIGQLLGDYHGVAHIIDADDGAEYGFASWSVPYVPTHGVRAVEHDMAALDRAWREFISVRRAGAAIG